MVKINANESVYEITKAHPEVVEIMIELGFTDVARPGMVHNVGRNVSLFQGATLRNFDWEAVKKAFKDKGYEISREE
jgi:hypothetical protein